MAALMRCSRLLPVLRSLSLSHGLLNGAVDGTCHRYIPAIQNLITKEQKCHMTSTPPALQLSANLAEVTRPQAPSSPAERLLINIEIDINRFHRIDEIKFTNFLRVMERADPLSDLQANQVLRCTGSLLFDVQPQQRCSLTEEVWEKLKKSGVHFGVTHYNTLLRVYLENKHDFHPVEFLGQMEAEGIAPNRVTYQHFIAKYCETGDIQGASQILEHMKKSDLPITEQVFNSLITGHFRANDEAAALSTMKLMKEAGMSPSHFTFGTVALRYAEKGNIAEMKKMLQESEISGATVRPAQLLEIVSTLTTIGQTELVPEMLSTIQRQGMAFRGDAVKCINSLLFEGHDDIAYKVFLTMQKPTRLDEDEATFGRFLIRALVKNERPLDKVLEIVTHMSKNGYNRDGLISIPHLAYLLEKTEYALEALERIKMEGEPLRMHYLWPAICQFKKQGNKDGVYRVVDKMRTLPDQSRVDVNRTVDDYLLPSLSALGESEESLCDELQKRGLPSDVLASGVFVHLLKQQGMQAALDYVQGKAVRVSHFVLSTALKDHYTQNRDWQAMVQVLTTLKENVSNLKEFIEVTGDVLLRICRDNAKNSEVLEQVLEQFSEQNMKIFGIHEQVMRNLNLDLPDKVWEKVSGMVTAEQASPSQPTQFKTVQELMDMSEAQMEQILSEQPNNLTVKKWLLAKYCSTGKSEKAEELMASMDSVGFVYQGFLLRQIIFMYAFFKQDLEKSQMYLDKMEKEYPEFGSYIKSLVAIATVMVQNGSIPDGLALLKKYQEKHANFMAESGTSQSYMYCDICGKLVMAASKVGKPDETIELLDAIFDLGYVKSGSFSVLADYVQAYIDKGDLNETMEAFSLIVKKFHRTCHVDEMFIMCMKQEDPETLQKVLDLSIPIHGEMSTLNKLICNFVVCGQMEKAKKVLETPGIRAVMGALKTASNKFLANNMVTEMENLVEVTKHMFAIDLDQMLFELIRIYVKVGDYTKALDTLTRFEEEDVQPKARTLRYLGKVLESKEMAVPFQIPPYENREFFSSRTQSEEAKLADDVIRRQDVGLIMDRKENLDSQEGQGQKLSGAQLVSNTASALLKKKRFREFHALLAELASKGDVESLLHMKMQNVFSEKSINIRRSLFMAFINSNRIDEILEILQENPTDSHEYLSLVGVKYMMEKSPETMEKLDKLTSEAAKNGYLRPLNNLWMCYFLEQPEKADALLQQFPSMMDNLRITEICYSALKDKKGDPLHRLVELLRGQRREPLVMTYSFLVDLHCQNEDADSAAMTLEQMRGDGVKLEDINARVTKNLEKLLQDHKKSMPAGLSETINASQSDSDSSSSSSSDSDRGK